jgi:hypothetical protein
MLAKCLAEARKVWPMDVGNDPFPREEVTGLAAFENLEPVSSLSIEPEPPSDQETPLPTPRRRTLPPPAARTFPSPEGSVPFGSAAHPFSQSAPPPPPGSQRERFDGRGDPTMPLDLSAEADGGTADELFTHDTGGWDNPDEATRVVTPSMAPSGGRSADLQMDWDEDEPPTRMRAEGMLEDVPPSLGLPMDWDDANSATQIYDNQDQHDQQNEGLSSSDPGAVATGVSTLSGGRPSPFPSAPRPANGVAPSSQVSGAPSPFATTAIGRDNWAESLRSGDKRTWIWAAAGALGLIVLALITRALVGGSALGALTVVTTPTDARVLIDGRPVAGTASPYALSDIAAGKHEMVVSKAGFVDYHGTFSLARGETKTLPTVELVPSVREVGFSIRSAPPGAEIWVDGRAADQLTPARLTGVTPGIHRLQLKRAGYADFELQMFVPEATVLQLPTAELVMAPSSKVAAVSKPAQPKAAPVARTSAPSPSPSAADPSAAAERRAAAREARLAKKEAARAPAAASPFAAATATRAPLPMNQPAMAAPSGAAGGRTGTLRVNSRPWAQVFVDGRLMGNTPQPALQLSPGNHQIKLLNQPMGLSKSFSISIKAGQMVTKVLNLAE